MTSLPTPVFILQSSKPINCLRFSRSHESILFSGHRNGDLTVHSLELRRTLFAENANNQSILSIDEIDEHNFLSFTRNGSVFKWTSNDNHSTWISSCIYEKESTTFCPISIAHDKHSILIPSSESGAIDCVDLNMHKQVKRLKSAENRGMLMGLKVISENHFLAGFESGELTLNDFRRFETISTLNLFSGQPLMCLDYSKSRNFGISGSADTLVKEFSLIEENRLTSSKSINLTNSGLNCVRVRDQDGKIFACGGWDAKIRVYGVKKANLLVVLDFHKDAITSIDFSRSNLMCAGSNDGIISFWNIYN